MLPDAEEDSVHKEVKHNYKAIQEEKEGDGQRGSNAFPTLLGTFAIPSIVAGLTFCIPLEHAFSLVDDRTCYFCSCHTPYNSFVGLLLLSSLVRLGLVELPRKELLLYSFCRFVFHELCLGSSSGAR